MLILKFRDRLLYLNYNPVLEKLEAKSLDNLSVKETNNKKAEKPLEEGDSRQEMKASTQRSGGGGTGAGVSGVEGLGTVLAILVSQRLWELE